MASIEDGTETMNRKLLVSVFNPQEAREAMLGGGRIIDSEDPRSALGCISPLQVMEIADTVVSFKKDLEVQLSTNIGEEQYIYDCYDDGYAVLKSAYEIKSKASQAAAGIACAMGTVAHPCNIVKVGVDSMPTALVNEVLSEIVTTLKYSVECRSTMVMSVFFVQDLPAWNERKHLKHVRRALVGLGKYISCPADDPAAFDLADYAIDNLSNWDGGYYFTQKDDVSVQSLIAVGALRRGSQHSHIKLTDVRPHSDFFPGVSDASTTREVLKAMIDVTADSGAGGIMLDNRVQSKIARICSVDTSSEGLVDINPFYTDYAGLPYHGVLSLEDIRFFVAYCHHRGIEASLAGSLQSAHAQQIWAKVPHLDQMANRDASSGVFIVPGSAERGVDSRQHRAIKSTLVRGIVPPEQGGVLNIPDKLKGDGRAMAAMRDLVALIDEERRAQDLPKLDVFFSDACGELVKGDLSSGEARDGDPGSTSLRTPGAVAEEANTGLFEPFYIGKVKLKNRLLRSATWDGMADEAGYPQENMYERYATVARGGVAMIQTGFTYINENSKSMTRQLGFYSDEQIPSFRKLADAVHQEGAKISLQLVHSGSLRFLDIGVQALAPSAVKDGLTGNEPVEMTIDDIEEVIGDFTAAAARGKEAGFDCVEVDMAQGFLMSQFFSPLSNRRTDGYGGSIENRARIGFELVAAIRERCGPSFPIIVKMNCADFCEGGLEAHDALYICKRLSDMGVDAIDLTGGTLAGGDELGPIRTKVHSREKEAYFKDYALKVKKQISCPLILVGGIRSLEVMEEIFEQGGADFFSMARPLICEPDLINRWRSGDRGKALCISCNDCFESGLAEGWVHCKRTEKLRAQAKRKRLKQAP